MKLRMTTLGVLLVLLTVPISSRAQEPVTHLRVDIVLTEYNGANKISSLPYTIYAASSARQGGAPASNIRMGVRVPVASGNSNSFNYMNVGTDIDCRAQTLDNGSYDLNIDVNRSSIYSAPKGDSEDQNIRALPDAPVVRNFDSHFDVSLREGETKEGTSAADPLNGHVLKISVTLHVLK